MAIELAAARVRGITPAEITRHLDRRFRLLTRGRRTAAARHQTLRNTIDWSYDLLDEPERTVLRRLGVFHAGFGLDAAEAVAADADLDAFEVMDLLVRLVDKSLVVAESRSGESRYRLLETIHDYAWERLEESGELDHAAWRHARHYVELAVSAGSGLEGPDELVWRARVEDDLENLRAALRWVVDQGDVDLALTEVEALNTVGSLRSPPFGLTALEVARMEGAEDHELYPMALASACMTETQDGTVEHALQLADAAEAAAARLWTDSPRHRKLRCRLWGCLTTAIAYGGDFPRLTQLARGELDDSRAIGDRFEMARALILLSSVLGPEHDQEAIRYGEDAVALAKQIGNPSYQAWAPMMLAGRLAASDPTRAETLLDEAVRAATVADNDFARSQAVNQLAFTQAERGDYPAASRSLLDMTTMGRATGDRGTAMQGLIWLACLLVLRGDEEGGIILGAWAEERGFSVADTSPDARQYGVFGVGPYRASREAQSETARRAVSQQVASMDDAQILEFVRRRIDTLSAAGR